MYIKDPVVTRILRDQKIPVIAFVANTGGLLGLCMGFSLVSVFEIVYHVIGALRKWWSSRLSASDEDAVTNSLSATGGGGGHESIRLNSSNCGNSGVKKRGSRGRQNGGQQCTTLHDRLPAQQGKKILGEEIQSDIKHMKRLRASGTVDQL